MRHAISIIWFAVSRHPNRVAERFPSNTSDDAMDWSIAAHAWRARTRLGYLIVLHLVTIASLALMVT